MHSAEIVFVRRILRCVHLIGDQMRMRELRAGRHKWARAVIVIEL
jgi:hypothetical protein